MKQDERIGIVFVTTGLSTGGAEVMLHRLATRMDPSRFDVKVIALLDKGQLGERLEADRVPVATLGLRRGRVSLSGLRRLAAVLDSFRPDVVQGWMYHGNLAALLSARFRRSSSRIVWGVRQSLYDLKKEQMLTRGVIWLCARLSRRPVAILYNSQISRQQHETIGFCPARSVVVPNGFELNRGEWSKPENRKACGIPLDRFVIGLVARYHPMKDHSNFLKAAAQVAKENPSAFFVLAGPGVDTRNRQLMDLATSLGLSDRLLLLGERQDVTRLMGSLDLLCLSSAWGEGFPNVVGEAMACGVPCVVTDVGDSAEIVGDTGLIVPPADPQALADAIGQLIAMGPEGRTRLGIAARQRIAERYELSSVVRRHQNLYEEIVSDVRYCRAAV